MIFEQSFVCADGGPDRGGLPRCFMTNRPRQVRLATDRIKTLFAGKLN